MKNKRRTRTAEVRKAIALRFYRERQKQATERAKDAAQHKAMKKAYAEQPYVRETAKVGRNDACPCGSGLKFKRCCIGKKED